MFILKVISLMISGKWRQEFHLYITWTILFTYTLKSVTKFHFSSEKEPNDVTENNYERKYFG